MNISLKTKISILLPLAVFTVVSIIIGATLWVNSLQENLGLMINLSGRQRMLSQKMTKELLCVINKKIEGNDSAAAECSSSMVASRELFGKTLNALTSGGETLGPDGKTVALPAPTNEEIVKILKESLVVWKEFERSTERLIANMDGRDPAAYLKALDFVEKNNLKLLHAMNEVTVLYEKESAKEVYLLQKVQLWSFVFTCIMVVVAYWVSVNLIIGPIDKMMEVLDGMAAGDLSNDLKITTNDEIGRMEHTINSITLKLRGMITDINDASGNVYNAGNKVTTAADSLAKEGEAQKISIENTSSSLDEMNVSMKEIAGSVSKLSLTADEASASTLEISASIDEVAKIAEELSFTVEEVSASITEMAASVKQITALSSDVSSRTVETTSTVTQIAASIGEVEENLKLSATLAQTTSVDAEKGREAVKKTIEGTKRIKETVDEALDVIQRLGSKSESIGDILNVVNDIAEQTNLLALNAAILAAQAGEHGKGFAVVADEIKQLSERTSVSIGEIAEMINSLQAEANNAVKSIRIGSKSVEEGLVISTSAGEALDKIISSANSSKMMAQQISIASAQQLQGSKLVSESMDMVSAMMGQVNKAIEDHERGNTYIAKASEKMKDAAFQVKKATREQSKGGELISRAIENISMMAASINNSTQEHTKGLAETVRWMEDIKNTSDRHVGDIDNLREVTGSLSVQVEMMENLAKKFKV